MNDLDALALRAQAGDRAALEAVVRELQAPMYHLATRYLGHADEARDATQEILILIITKLSTYRAESSLRTWAYRVACRRLLRFQSARRAASLEQLAAELGQPPEEPFAPADARLLEEEVFLGCTQAMLRALDRDSRIAFVLGGICELPSREAAFALGIGEAAFRKRLSRARAILDEFLLAHCGVANAENRCRCRHQVPHRIRSGRLAPAQLRYARDTEQTTLEALRARREVGRVRRSLELYDAQPATGLPGDLAARLQALLRDPTLGIFQ